MEAEQEGWRGEAAPAAAGRRQRRSAEADVAVAQRQFPGAIATMVLGAALLSERLDGCGFVQQLELHDAKHMHPLLMVVATALGAVAVWPRRRLEHEDSIDLVQEFAGRAAFAGLGAAIAAEQSTGKGLLRLLEVSKGCARRRARVSLPPHHPGARVRTLTRTPPPPWGWSCSRAPRTDVLRPAGRRRSRRASRRCQRWRPCSHSSCA